MARSNWVQAEIRERTLGGVRERYLYGGGFSFSRKFHPGFVGAWTEQRLFFMLSFDVLGFSPTGYFYTPGGRGRWSFGLQRDTGPSYNTGDQASCPLLLGYSGYAPASDLESTSLTTGGKLALHTRYSYRKIEGGTFTTGAVSVTDSFFSAQENIRNLMIFRIVNIGGGKYDLAVVRPGTQDAVELDISQNDTVDLYNLTDWADVLTALGPYGYTEDTSNMTNVSLDEATYGQLNAAYFNFNSRYQAVAFSGLMGKVIP